jgi:hypothetical protein
MNVPEATPAARPVPPRSTFVTVLAWIFIVLSGMATFVSLLQNIMVALLFRPEMMMEAAKDFPKHEGPAALASFMIMNFRLFLLLFLVLSALTLASAIGLLLRRNWGRMLFVALMVIGMAWNIVALGLMFLFFGAMADLPSRGAADAQAFHVFFLFGATINVLFVVGFTVLFGWIVKRLLSPDIRREFVADGA